MHRKKSLAIGLVPTMGNLHEGHLELVRQAKQDCDFVITSIFVNPTQFGPHEDLDSYPRTFDEDKAALAGLGCDGIFYPSVAEIYPQGPRLETRVSVPALSNILCGASRPGHFDGVCTVVAKLLNICMPDRVYFGEKDYQQLTIIRRMLLDLNMSAQVISVPTQRTASGLALSSRNNYLSEEQKQKAAILYTSLQQTAKALAENKEPDFQDLENTAIRQITESGLRIDYFKICNPQSLLPAQRGENEVRILTAAYLGDTRLIDNIAAKLDV